MDCAPGFAFEIRAKACTIVIHAIEAFGASTGQRPISVYEKIGGVDEQPTDPNAWINVADGVMNFESASRIEFETPVTIRENATHTLYIVGDGGVRYVFRAEPIDDEYV